MAITVMSKSEIDAYNRREEAKAERTPEEQVEYERWRIEAMIAQGFSFRIEPDIDAKPTDYDAYDEAEIAAWNAGNWQFVIITLMSPGDRPEILESLGAVEYGGLFDDAYAERTVPVELFDEYAAKCEEGGRD